MFKILIKFFIDRKRSSDKKKFKKNNSSKLLFIFSRFFKFLAKKYLDPDPKNLVAKKQKSKLDAAIESYQDFIKDEIHQIIILINSKLKKWHNHLAGLIDNKKDLSIKQIQELSGDLLAIEQTYNHTNRVIVDLVFNCQAYEKKILSVKDQDLGAKTIKSFATIKTNLIASQEKTNLTTNVDYKFLANYLKIKANDSKKTSFEINR